MQNVVIYDKVLQLYGICETELYTPVSVTSVTAKSSSAHHQYRDQH